jgi:hypothetical protein
LGFAERSFVIHPGNPAPLCLHAEPALYNINKVPALDGNFLSLLSFPDPFETAENFLHAASMQPTSAPFPLLFCI